MRRPLFEKPFRPSGMSTAFAASIMAREPSIRTSGPAMFFSRATNMMNMIATQYHPCHAAIVLESRARTAAGVTARVTQPRFSRNGDPTGRGESLRGSRRARRGRGQAIPNARGYSEIVRGASRRSIARTTPLCGRRCERPAAPFTYQVRTDKVAAARKKRAQLLPTQRAARSSAELLSQHLTGTGRGSPDVRAPSRVARRGLPAGDYGSRRRFRRGGLPGTPDYPPLPRAIPRRYGDFPSRHRRRVRARIRRRLRPPARPRF